jgi:hypothetical protein
MTVVQVSQLEDAKFSFVYMTDDVMDNPWDSLSSYMAQLVALAAPSFVSGAGYGLA